MANNNNAPAIIASTPRPFNTVTPIYNNDQNDVVYITPSPSRLYVNQGGQPVSNVPTNLLLSREIQPPYLSGSQFNSQNFYRNRDYGYQNVRPLDVSGPSAPDSQTITNLAFRNANNYKKRESTEK